MVKVGIIDRTKGKNGHNRLTAWRFNEQRQKEIESSTIFNKIERSSFRILPLAVSSPLRYPAEYFKVVNIHSHTVTVISRALLIKTMNIPFGGDANKGLPDIKESNRTLFYSCLYNGNKRLRFTSEIIFARTLLLWRRVSKKGVLDVTLPRFVSLSCVETIYSPSVP